MSSKIPPRHECFAIFDGVRLSRPGYVEVIHEPVRIIEVQYGNTKELAVCMFGRQTRWPLRTYDGTWTLIELEPS